MTIISLHTPHDGGTNISLQPLIVWKKITEISDQIAAGFISVNEESSQFYQSTQFNSCRGWYYWLDDRLTPRPCILTQLDNKQMPIFLVVDSIDSRIAHKWIVSTNSYTVSWNKNNHFYRFYFLVIQIRGNNNDDNNTWLIIDCKTLRLIFTKLHKHYFQTFPTLINI